MLDLDDIRNDPPTEIAVLLARIAVLIALTPGARAAGLPAYFAERFTPEMVNSVHQDGLFGPPEALGTPSQASACASATLNLRAVREAALDCRVPLQMRACYGVPLAKRLRSAHASRDVANAATGSQQAPTTGIAPVKAELKVKVEPGDVAHAATESQQAPTTGMAPELIAVRPESVLVARQPDLSAQSPSQSAWAVQKLASHTGHCACCGLCGSKRCAAGKNAFHRQVGAKVICGGAAAGASKYCRLCVCEMDQCQSPRNQGRWCKAHKGAHAGTKDSRLSYSNMFNPACLKLRADWPEPIRIVARLAFALPRMLPDDAEVLMDMRPETLTPVSLIKTLIAHAIKWPWVVQSFAAKASAVSNLAVTAAELRTASRELAGALLDEAVAASGWTNKDMFDRLNSGLMHAVTGLAVQGGQLGLIASQTEERLRGPGESGTRVTLGPAQTEYFVAQHESEATARVARSAAGPKF